MEVILKWNKGFSTPTNPGTLGFPKGIDFLLKALQNGKGKKTLSAIKNVSEIIFISLKTIEVQSRKQ